MRQKSGPAKEPAAKIVKDIRRATRRQFSAEEKIRIVLEGLRGEESIAELCRFVSGRGRRDRQKANSVMPDGSRLPTCMTTEACPAAPWSGLRSSDFWGTSRPA